MQIGVFAKTFATCGALPTLQAVANAGFSTTQFNLACLGLPAMPDHIALADAASIGIAARQTGISVAAVSGTYNMIHPDREVRRAGLRQLGVLCGACAAMDTRLVTVCTGTRDPVDQWRWHPDNAAPDAWQDLLMEMTAALRIAERFDVYLGVEPELANVVSSATHARRLIDDLDSKRIRIVLDPANLVEMATSAERRTIVEHAVDLLGASIAMAHAKDRNADGSFAAAGHGVIDFGHFVARLRAIGFDGPLVAHHLAAAQAPGVAAFLSAVVAEGDPAAM